MIRKAVTNPCYNSPQDLSAKFKTVSVQTEDTREHMDVFRDLMAGFSEHQVRVLIGVLSQFLWKQAPGFGGINCQEIPESETFLNRIQNLQVSPVVTVTVYNMT